MTLLSGTRVGPYEVLALLGSGGMGEVYGARDPRLGRDVALKVLPTAFAEEPGRLRRFQQEARTLAALSHPSVVQVYEAGEQDGLPYLVMEFVHGSTLRTFLTSGRIPWRKAVEWGAAVADGLAAAHAKGIVHRDLKPENLIIDEDGRIRILDFGLAKLRPLDLETASTVDAVEARTQGGVLLGTVGYMSPEQVQGLPADARSDLFTLGAVLYEMVTGHRAFARDSAVETMAAILKDPVPEASRSGSGGNAELDRILAHCLEKAPSARFQAAKDLAFALRSLLSTGSASAGLPEPRPLRHIVPKKAALLAGIAVFAAIAGAFAPSLLHHLAQGKGPSFDPRCVAVQALQNRTGDPSLDTLGQQTADLVRQDLQHVANLRVIPRAVPAGPEAARYTAGGSYFLKGGDLEFQAQVAESASGRVIYTLGPWHAPRTDPDKALPDLRQNLAGAVAWCYEEYFGLDPGSTTPPSLEAYFAWVEGRNLLHPYLGSCNAIPCFLKSVEQDPGFNLAKLDLAEAYQSSGDNARADEVLKGLESRVANLTPVERLLLQAARNGLEGRNLARLQAERDILTLIPDSYFLRFQRGLHELGLNLVGSAIRDLSGIPPSWYPRAAGFDYWPAVRLCQAYHLAGRFDEEIDLARKSQALYPDVLDFRLQEAVALAALGRVREVEWIIEMAPSIPRRPRTRTAWGIRWEAMMELRVRGHREASDRLARSYCADVLATPPEERKSLGFSTALTLMVLDRPGEALALLKPMADEFPSEPHVLGTYGSVLALLGRREDALRVDARLALIESPFLRGAQTYARAGIHSCLGEKDEALALLRKSLGQGVSFLPYFHPRLDPVFEPLHGYPPYEELMRPKD